jgi:hypothetical protein
MVDGYRHDHLVAVSEVEGYTGDISGAMRFCGKCWDDGCSKNQGSKPLEGAHIESSSAGLAEENSGRMDLPGLDGVLIIFFDLDQEILRSDYEICDGE